MDVSNDVSILKGVGPKLLEKLNKCGIFTIMDLLLYFPRDYEFINGNIPFEEIDGEEKQILSCKVVAFKRDVRTRTGKTITTIEFDYNGHRVEGKWFNQPYIKNNYRIGVTYNLIGKFKRVGKTLEIVNPLVGCEDALKSEIIPKYPLKGDLTDKLITKLISLVLDSIKITENLPIEMCEKYGMISLDKAIREIHFPKDKEMLDKAITRLKFQELFTYSMKLLLLKRKIKQNNKGISIPWDNERMGELREALPYQLTGAQARVVREILRDQKSTYPMNRLVQGDVGSGKTVVALIAIYNAYTNGYKSAFMVPTEILANQHYEEAKKLLSQFGVEIELLTGSTTAKEKKRIKERIADSAPLVVIGTHALIQEDVNFNKLGLVITDEQHRFGVRQRAKLSSKGSNPDILVMTATPIPRTLALILYGDLDISIIDELPPGRQPIDTRAFESKKRDFIYSNFVRDEIEKGRQVYIVCPLVEESEAIEAKAAEDLRDELKEKYFSDLNVEVLHGKMKPSLKDKIMEDFKNNKIQILVSTTVIEVGVNVPNATLMIIENAERFGLAQLHQLRGRVGRGSHKSHCILIYSSKTNVCKERMEIMEETNDGFKISEKDLEIRGPGEFFGTRQHGIPELKVANIFKHIKILKLAQEESKFILKQDRNLEKSEHILLKQEIVEKFSSINKEISLN